MSAADRDRIEPVRIAEQCTRSINPAGDSIDTRTVFASENLEGPEDEPILRRVVFASVVHLGIVMSGYWAARTVANAVARRLLIRAGAR